MKGWSQVRSVVRNLFHREHLEARLNDELRGYVEMLTDEKVAAGVACERRGGWPWWRLAAWRR